MQCSALREIVGVGYKFGVSPRTQFVQIETLAFAFGGNPMGANEIQGPVQTISQRQHKTKQGRDPHELR